LIDSVGIKSVVGWSLSISVTDTCPGQDFVKLLTCETANV